MEILEASIVLDGVDANLVNFLALLGLFKSFVKASFLATFFEKVVRRMLRKIE